jgi:dynein heavy chain
VPDIIKGKSACAGGLCDFVINLTAYYNVVVSVEPKRRAVDEAKQTLAEATTKKEEVDALVAELKEKLAVL